MFIKSSTRLFDLFSLLVSICMVELLTATCVDALPNLTPNTEIDEGIERIAYSDRRNKLTLMETTDSFQLRLRAQGGVRFKVFTVDRPKRLVIDVYGARLRRNRRLPVTSSSELKRVRLGVHSNRLRAVLDLNIDWFPQVSGSLVGRTLELVVSRKQVGSAIPYELAHQLEFNRGVNVLAKAVAVDSVGMLPAPVIMGVRVVKEPSTLPVLEGSAPVLDVASVDQIEKTKFAALELDERMASLLPSRLAPSPIEPTDLSESVAPKAVQERVISSEPEVLVPLVQQIRFSSFKNRVPVIRIALGSDVQFQLVRTNPRGYRLLLPGVRFAGEHLQLPQYPPHDFAGVMYVKPEESSMGAMILIGVNKSTRLSAFSRDGSVYLRVVKPR